jgi:hypothetical protein
MDRMAQELVSSDWPRSPAITPIDIQTKYVKIEEISKKVENEKKRKFSSCPVNR